MIGRRGASAAGLSSRTGLAAMATHDALLLLLVLWLRCVSVWGGYPFRPPMELDVTPRTTVFASGLLGCERFQGSVVNYSTLLLEEKGERVEKAEEAGEAQGGEESEGGGGGARARGGGGEGGGGVLYVGARGAVYALQANNISASPPRTIEWEAPADQKKQCLNKGRDNKTECFNHIRFLQRFNSTHLYMCGTHAFKPLCAYIDADKFQISSGFEEGREKCPYDPAKGYTGLLIDEQMYTASQYEFRSSPDIKRNWPTPTIKTEEAPTRWLLEADFVGSALVRESVNSSVGDDDKIYFFFTEKSQEQTPFGAQGRVARVARICKGDRGGHLTLQRKWTSFLKARLTCSLHDYQLHFNVLRSVFTFNGVSAQDTLFYGIFGLEWKNVKASAICQYSIGDMWQVFEGPYMESQDTSYKWSEYTGKTPEPRPGSCITDRLRAKGMNSSFDLPDDVLHFVRRHPLMFRQVQPRLQRPLLFKRSTDYTQLAVHGQPALDGHTYHVLFIGTDEGWLHRAVEVEGRLHIIEELQLFEQAQPVDSIVISGAQRSVYVGSASEVVQLPMSTCGRYASCYDCVFSRDPFCAWDGNGEQCVEISTHSDRSNLRQDVQQGNRGCENETADASASAAERRPGDLGHRNGKGTWKWDELCRAHINSGLQWNYSNLAAQSLGDARGRRAAAMRAELQRGVAGVDPGRRASPGLRAGLGLPRGHRRPPADLRAARAERPLPLLRPGERRARAHGRLRGGRPRGAAAGAPGRPRRRAHAAARGPRRGRGGPDHRAARSSHLPSPQPELRHLGRRAPAPLLDPSPARPSPAAALGLPVPEEHGGHVLVPGDHPGRAVPGADRGAALRGLLRERPAGEVLAVPRPAPPRRRRHRHRRPGAPHRLLALQRHVPAGEGRRAPRRAPPDRARRGPGLAQQGAPRLAPAGAALAAAARARGGVRQRPGGDAAQRAEEDEREQLRAAAAERVREHLAALLLLHRGAQPHPGEEEAHAAGVHAG
ncbi:semaphorin-4G-like isoform X1 [Sardina pilchardus]|uniref:semaphorin-4G-like isoform X1 n=1 Tax=Sardina pilchardus TaxID=27697 RepID=UPI002E1306DB